MLVLTELAKLDGNDIRAASYLGQKVFAAKVLEILNGDSAISVSVEDLQVAFDVGSGGRKDPVEWLVGIYYHGYDLNTVDNPVSVPVVSIQNPPGDILGTFPIGQTRIDQHRIVGGISAGGLGVAVAALLNWVVGVHLSI